MENNLKREIPLKQDTPMWHFQSYQSGCCLRATEVKPKLDKFLIKLVDFQENYYLDKSKNNALDYKLWFEPIGCPKEIPIKKPSTDKFGNLKFKKGKQMYDNLYPLFFANMGATDRDKKHLVYYPEGVTMHLFSFNTELLNFIENNLPAFFASHSFGTRQDKGFGFFSLKNKNLNLSDAKYLFKLPKDVKKLDFETLFQYIHYFHKMIRSGINENGVYYKSFMYFYAKEKCNTTWDKPVIRYNFELFSPLYKHISCQEKNETNDKIKNRPQRAGLKDERELFAKEKKYKNSKILFRDALGLASKQMWLSYGDTIDIVSKEVDRFKSPITYRPVYENDSWRVYLYLDQGAIDSIKSRSFEIHNSRNREIENMRIYEEFSLEEYFDFIIQIGLARHTDSKEHGNKKLNYIENIFNNNNLKKLSNNGNTTK
jgi:hypothetical protein